MKFDFETDSKSQEFFEWIVESMTEQFSISMEEALGRVNRAWRGARVVGSSETIYHDPADEWARHTYYAARHWWLLPRDERAAKPYP